MKIHHRARFSIFAFFGLKRAKKGQKKKEKKMPKSKPFDEILLNLVCCCLFVNENSPQSPIFDFAFFGLKRAKKGQKKKKKLTGIRKL